MLTIDGRRLNSLSTDDLQYFETRYFLVPGTGTIYVDAKLSVIRQRAVGDGFHEELTILNHDEEPVDLKVRIDADSDFADLFEVKDAVARREALPPDRGRTPAARVLPGDVPRETAISSSAPAQVDENGFTFSVHIEPHARWTRDLDVVTAQFGGETSCPAEVRAEPARRGRTWRGAWNSGSMTLHVWSATGSR